MTSREDFLGRVRREMAKTGNLSPAEATARPEKPVEAAAWVRDRARWDTEALLARFRVEAERVGVVVHRAATIGDAAEIVEGVAAAREARRVATWGRRTLGLALAVAARLRKAGLEVIEASPDPVTPEDRERLRGLLAEVDLGLTAVDLAIAETGSLVLVSGPGKGRGVSLLPPCHVAVFGRAQLVASLEDAGVVLEAWGASEVAESGSNVVIVTGPSRTADIELTLTRGVHGPGELHAVFVDSL